MPGRKSMAGHEFLLHLPAAAGASAVAVELFLRLPILTQLEAFGAGAMRALEVVRSPRISDHWKERTLPRYALRILRASLLLGAFLLLCAAVFVLVYGLLLLPAGRSGSPMLASLAELPLQLAILFFGVAYAALRLRLGRRHRDQPTDYGPGARMLHRLALGSNAMRELAFDLDERIYGARARALEPAPPVYVASLARSGTTLLLQLLHATGSFQTLTYRAMPFVTAPALWSRVSRPARRAATTRERAHGDQVEVGLDSPEAFEEVFWSTWCRGRYLQLRSLLPETRAPVPAAVVESYRGYVARILWSRRRPGVTPRYLAKNNNNVLRIGSLRRAFPDALIIVPFRHPADHAASLLRQHRRFLELHANDPFGREYMGWLVHHEFGADFRPFLVEEGLVPADPGVLLEAAYWLDYWRAVYGHLLQRHGREVLWVDYDALCREPGPTLARLEAALQLTPGRLQGQAASVRRDAGSRPRLALPTPVERVYRELVDRAASGAASPSPGEGAAARSLAQEPARDTGSPLQSRPHA